MTETEIQAWLDENAGLMKALALQERLEKVMSGNEVEIGKYTFRLAPSHDRTFVCLMATTADTMEGKELAQALIDYGTRMKEELESIEASQAGLNEASEEKTVS